VSAQQQDQNPPSILSTSILSPLFLHNRTARKGKAAGFKWSFASAHGSAYATLPPHNRKSVLMHRRNSAEHRVSRQNREVSWGQTVEISDQEDICNGSHLVQGRMKINEQKPCGFMRLSDGRTKRHAQKWRRRIPFSLKIFFEPICRLFRHCDFFV
jgi:hypothetical protein